MTIHINPQTNETYEEFILNGHITHEYRDLSNAIHREPGPAIISYWDNGNIKCESYFINGYLSRIDGPATIFYYENGKVQAHFYIVKNCLHREDGPARIDYSQDGKIIYKGFYYKDIKYPSLKKLHNKMKLEMLQ